MKIDFSRRRFLQTGPASILASKLHIPQEVSFSNLLEQSLAARLEMVNGSHFSMIDNFVSIEFSENDTYRQATLLKEFFVNSIYRVEKILNKLSSFNDTSVRDGFRPLDFLLNVENQIRLTNNTHKISQYENISEEIRKYYNVDEDVWHEWCEEFLCDDRSVLDHPERLISDNTGGLSQFLMDCFDTKMPLDMQIVVRQICVELQEAYPVNIPFSSCSILRDIISDASAGDSVALDFRSRLMRSQRPFISDFNLRSETIFVKTHTLDDLLPLHFDHFGGLVGTDVY